MIHKIMNIYKLATSFQKKLSLASNLNWENLQKIYKSVKDLNTNKELWMNHADPYADNDPEVGKAINNIYNIVYRAYNQAVEYGMPTSGQNSYAGFLSNLDHAISSLEEMSPFKILDTIASSKLSTLKQILEKAQSDYLPVAIPAKNQVITLPEDTIVGNPNNNTGIAYNNTDEEESQESNNMSEPKRNWSGFFE